MFRTLCIVKLDHPGFFFLSFVSQNFKIFLVVFCMDLVKERMLCILLHCISILLKCETKGLYTEMYLKAQGDHLWWCSHLCWSCPLTSVLTISVWRVRSECKGFKSLTAQLLMIVSKSTIRFMLMNRKVAITIGGKRGKDFSLLLKQGKKASHLMCRHLLPFFFLLLGHV